MILLDENIFTFNDYKTGEQVVFNSRNANRSGGTSTTYTKFNKPNYNRAAPIFAGTIRRGERFVSLPKSVTVRKRPYSFYDLIYGPYVIEVLDSLPTGIRYVPRTNGDVVFLGEDVQIVPDVGVPNCHNYPLQLQEGSRCYFRVRAKREYATGLYSEWIYYFNIEMDWSSIRDAFILNSSERFSNDQKVILNNQDFIDNNKSRGYYK